MLVKWKDWSAQLRQLAGDQVEEQYSGYDFCQAMIDGMSPAEALAEVRRHEHGVALASATPFRRRGPVHPRTRTGLKH